MNEPIYLDYNATTPVDPRVVEAMIPYLHEMFGNASSGHSYGHHAKDAMERARTQTASLIGAHPKEIVFTGGGSEANNLAIKGVVFANVKRKPHVVTATTEHPAVLNTIRYLGERFNIASSVLPVDEYGRVSVDEVRKSILPNTVLVSVMHANNEVGTIQPIAKIGEVAHTAGALLHVDAAQSAGKIEIDVDRLGVDLLTLAGHKLYAPKGIGALYVREGTRLDPLVHGSNQEAGLRAGTENVASIVALGEACALATEHLATERSRLKLLRDRLQNDLMTRVPGAVLNGHPTERLPNTLNISLPGVSGQSVLANARGVAASTGSACHSTRPEPSSVLLAMGMSEERALGALRLSLGRWTTNTQIEQAAGLLADAYGSLRSVVAGAIQTRQAAI